MSIANILETHNDDPIQCADITRVWIQNLIYRRLRMPAIIWAVNWAFADILTQRSCDASFVIKTMALFSTLSDEEGTDAMTAQAVMEDMLSELAAKNFSLDAIAWALIGALSGLHNQLNARLSEEQRLAYVERLVGALERARAKHTH